MPHIRMRGLKLETVNKISSGLIDGLTSIIECDPSWFTIEYLETTFIEKGVIVKGYPFVEILWFDRGQKIKDEVAKYITNILEKEEDYSAVTVIFTNLEGKDYYENGEHF